MITWFWFHLLSVQKGTINSTTHKKKESNKDLSPLIFTTMTQQNIEKRIIFIYSNNESELEAKNRAAKEKKLVAAFFFPNINSHFEKRICASRKVMKLAHMGPDTSPVFTRVQGNIVFSLSFTRHKPKHNMLTYFSSLHLV